MPNDLIDRQQNNKTQATQLALTITSPSPFWGTLYPSGASGKLEGPPMPHDRAYLQAENQQESQ